MIRLHGERDGYVGLHPGVIKGEWGRGKGVGVFGTWYSIGRARDTLCGRGVWLFFSFVMD